jgi:hypothetical protein
MRRQGTHRGKIISSVFAACAVAVLAANSPYVPWYGGKIWFINNSSYNLLLEFSGEDSARNTIESKLYIEKEERLPINHVFRSLELADPNKFFNAVKIYDIDTGSPLKELHLTDPLFSLDSGSVNSCDAEFYFQIHDGLLELFKNLSF